jgi:hypothetical protein
MVQEIWNDKDASDHRQSATQEGMKAPLMPLPEPHQVQTKRPDSWPRSPSLSSRNNLLGFLWSTEAVKGKLVLQPRHLAAFSVMSGPIAPVTGDCTGLDFDPRLINNYP